MHLDADGIRAESALEPMETLFFHGPLIAKPASQGREDYPKDYRAKIAVSSSATLGSHSWSCSTIQGTTATMKFMVGDLPELVESELEGPQQPVSVRLPLTVNGRIFPREDSDAWSFHVERGTRITCEIKSRELGSPLQAVLELFDPQGRQLIAETSGNSRFGDPFVSFVSADSGSHSVRVRDAGFSGGQAHVYRLSLYEGGKIRGVFPLGATAGKQVPVVIRETGISEPQSTTLHAPEKVGIHLLGKLHPSAAVSGIPFETNNLPEAVRSASGDLVGLQDGFAPVPGVLNGCILAPAQVHEWPVRLEPKTTLRAEVLASALGSRLDSVLSLVDGNGREVAKNDDSADGRPDSMLLYTSEKGGEFLLRIAERFASRHGEEFGYRLKLTRGEAGDFQLRLAADFLNTPRTSPEPVIPEAKPAAKGPSLKVDVLSPTGNLKEIQLEVEGLPPNISFEPKSIPAKAKTVELRFTPAPDASLGVYPIRIHGVLSEGSLHVRRTAAVSGMDGSHTPDAVKTVRLGVVPRVPFKFAGDYWITVDQPSGTRMTKKYRIERNGYSGPLRAMLSDKQIRCLQRAEAKPVDIPAEATEFEFAVEYPTEVQLGWTSRIQVMLVGSTTDDSGRERPISYTSSDPDDQMISVLTSGWIGVQLERTSFPGAPGIVEIPFRVRRHETLKTLPVRVGLRTPAHIRGIDVAEVQLNPGEQNGVLKVRIQAGAGPFNLPLEVVAKTIPQSPGEATHTAALPVELLSDNATAP